MISTVTLKALRPRLPQVIERIDRKLDRFVVTRRGQPVAVMLSIDDYEALMETLDILADPKAIAGLRQGERDYRAGKTRPWDAVKRDLAKL